MRTAWRVLYSTLVFCAGVVLAIYARPVYPTGFWLSGPRFTYTDAKVWLSPLGNTLFPLGTALILISCQMYLTKSQKRTKSKKRGTKGKGNRVRPFAPVGAPSVDAPASTEQTESKNTTQPLPTTTGSS